ncbi:MAG: D-tyrosyl-tRNA(Tyr) deacylase, partial [Clostridia bacterium]|nr:D-tyrosyl-tRNA(Tyr) deacylase [Clostridia bacterium]
MKAVIQRTKQTSLRVDGALISEIPFGLTVFLGVGRGDNEAQAVSIAKKIANHRIFEDENGKMNLSVKDVGGEVLLVSQFTLYGDCSHGNRPSFTLAEEP